MPLTCGSPRRAGSRSRQEVDQSQALVGDMKAPTVWLTAIFALAGPVIARSAQRGGP
ncbi:hypothetical protein ACWEOW_18540 [Monashia sp. NPDC004114]